MNAAIIWAVLGLSASGTVTGLGFADSTQPLDGRRGACVQFSQDLRKEAKTMDIRLTNGCSDDQACKVAWVVTCDEVAGAATSEEKAVLTPQESKTFQASATHCDGGWTISAPRWTCASAPRP